MKKITRWFPDTCSCVIDFEWDTDNPNAPHTGKEVVKACLAHQGFDATAHYNKVLSENQTKNLVIKHVIENAPELVDVDEKGNKTLKNGKMAYFFDENRKLNVIATGLTALNKDAIVALIGSEKIIING